ncbi:MAG: hypothetical protein WC595_03720 [Candidatus Nanoarchaeia archaeon]
MEEKPETLEKKIESENMTFGSVFKSMIPSVVVGTLAATGCQEVCSSYSSDPKVITSVGMAGQFAAGYLTYFGTYLQDNKERLRQDNGKINWKQYGQEIGSVLLSDRVGNGVWATAYGLANGVCLRYNLDPSLAGTISGITSGVVYSAFTGAVAPKVNRVLSYLKEKFGRKKEVLTKDENA